MAEISVTIENVTREAKLTWDGESVPLSQSKNKYTAKFNAPKGNNTYAILVWGPPGDEWKATVTDGTTTQKHRGHMSTAGYGSSGTTPFQVK